MSSEQISHPVQHPVQPPHSQQTRRATVTDALLLGQHLGEAVGAARTLIDKTAAAGSSLVAALRREYYGRHSDEGHHLLWLRFVYAQQIHARLEQAIQATHMALNAERSALVEAEAERSALATIPLPGTVEQEALEGRAAGVRLYKELCLECQQRTAAIADLEHILPGPEKVLPDLIATTARVLEAVVTIEREAFVQRVCDAHEFEHFRARLEYLHAMAHTHEAELAEWSQRAGRLLQVPSVKFPWPSPTVCRALLEVPVEGPTLVWKTPIPIGRTT